MAEGAAAEGEAAARGLGAAREPFLIGVRHHSPALAAVMPALLDAFGPSELLLELPPDFAPWLPFLGSDELFAPVALAAHTAEAGLSFYPFADFSPELAAVRWAQARGVPIRAIDRPLRARVRSEEDRPDRSEKRRSIDLLAPLADGGDAGEEDLWDQMVEAPGATASPESLRRAALSFGYLLRAETRLRGRLSASDVARERHLREGVRAAVLRGQKVAAVVGAFHANALLAAPFGEPEAEPPPRSERAVPLAGSSLVPYDFGLFDSRSGYPAGIRDPALVQLIYELRKKGKLIDEEVPALLVAVARSMRQSGHVASLSSVQEAARFCLDLAALRGLSAPGRRELSEAVAACFGEGDVAGRGQALGRALQTIFVGYRRGRLPPGTPRSGVSRSVEALLVELRLPAEPDGPERDGASWEKTLSLDPYRSPLDARRLIALHRLTACGIPYAEPLAGAVRGLRGELTRLTLRFHVRFTPETAARLELLAPYGITLPQATEGVLRGALRSAWRAETARPEDVLAVLRSAMECALPALAAELWDDVDRWLLPTAGLPDLLTALSIVGAIEGGAFPAAPGEATLPPLGTVRSLAEVRVILGDAAARAVLGIAGSERDEDVVALGELLVVAREPGPPAVGQRTGLEEMLVSALRRFEHEGSALLQGAALAGLALTGAWPFEEMFRTFASTFDEGGFDLPASRRRSARIRGALLLSSALFEGHPAFAETVVAELARLSDERFLARLPSLRAGFDVLPPAGRQRLLDTVRESASVLELTMPDAALAAHALADRAIVKMLSDLSFPLPLPQEMARPTHLPPLRDEAEGTSSLRVVDRLRLLLGRERAALGGEAARCARLLEGLYGEGEGEGSRAGEGGAVFPSVREWAEELGSAFDANVREEILARAVLGGQAEAALELDPDEAHPSVELLSQVLALSGSVGESRLAPLRRLARRIIDALARELARQVRPALAGLALPRATRRPSGPLDLRRTIERNLHTVSLVRGERRLAPTRFLFRTRARKSLDWHIVLLVDVSGSMEASVVYSALMAGILSRLPAVSTRFFAFSDTTLDLSEHVADPLELLLAVRVGGGTAIAKAVRRARAALVNPARTLFLLVTDFEEGAALAPLLGEIRALVASGVTPLGLAALGDDGAPRFHRGNAERAAEAGMPVAALSPLALAQWVGERLREDVR